MKRKTWLYKIFGAYVLSNIKCSYLQTQHMPKSPQKTISLNFMNAKDVTDKRFKRNFSKSSKRDLLLTNEYAVFYDPSFRVLVENDAITIVYREELTNDLFIKFMLETAVLFYWTSKGAVFFHASSITISGNRGIVFLGDSGAGKSTISAHFHKLGYTKTSDDTCIISFIDEIPYIIPSADSQFLNEESLNLLGYKTSQKNHGTWASKFELQINTKKRDHQGIAKIYKIYCLGKSKRLKNISIRTLNNLQKVKLLLRHQIRNKYHELFLKRIIALACTVEIKKIQRPLTKNTLNDIADKIVNS